MASLLSPWWETGAADRIPWTGSWPHWLSTDVGRSILGVVAFWVSATVGLGILGMIVFVLYLRTADLIRCHTVEAFSALQITGYKCHLRLKVTPAQVMVWVVAMDTVPRAWRWRRLTDIPRPRAYILERFDVDADACPSLRRTPVSSVSNS